jgi:hypothetical protein
MARLVDLPPRAERLAAFDCRAATLCCRAPTGRRRSRDSRWGPGNSVSDRGRHLVGDSLPISELARRRPIREVGLPQPPRVHAA